MVPELRQHADAVGRLGCAGMSSDESSEEYKTKIYHIRKLPWRALELGPFLHTIDRVTEQVKNATSIRGSRKYRLPGENESQGQAAALGLPNNLYGPA